MSTFVISELFDRRAVKLVQDGRYFEECADQMVSLKDKKHRSEEESVELKRLQSILASAPRETANDFILEAVPFTTKEKDLVTQIQNCLEHQTTEKIRLQKELDDLVKEFRGRFFEDEIKEQDKAKKPKISSRSKVTRNKRPKKIRITEEFVPEEGQSSSSRLDDPQNKSSTPSPFTYKRRTHFDEILRRASGKASDQRLEWDVYGTEKPEKTNVEQLVDWLVGKVGREMEMSHIPAHKITPKRVRAKLKKLKGSQYFEFSTCVACRLNPDFKPLALPPEHESTLLTFFAKLEPVFDKIKKEVRSTRKNFMSYPNTAYKICEMLGQEEENRVYLTYLKHFSPLKSEQLQIEQDEFWERCCDELKMPFYRTIGNAVHTKRPKPQNKPKFKEMFESKPKSSQKRKREPGSESSTTATTTNKKRKVAKVHDT